MKITISKYGKYSESLHMTNHDDIGIDGFLSFSILPKHIDIIFTILVLIAEEGTNASKGIAGGWTTKNIPCMYNRIECKAESGSDTPTCQLYALLCQEYVENDLSSIARVTGGTDP